VQPKRIPWCRIRSAATAAWVLASMAAVNGVAWAAGSTGTSTNGIPPVSYTTGNSALTQNVTTGLENIATTIRDILGAAALVAILVAALTNQMVHDARAKDRAKEFGVAAVVGLLLAAFAPAIVNWFANLGG
jgi:hypothetical protein